MKRTRIFLLDLDFAQPVVSNNTVRTRSTEDVVVRRTHCDVFLGSETAPRHRLPPGAIRIVTGHGVAVIGQIERQVAPHGPQPGHADIKHSLVHVTCLPVEEVPPARADMRQANQWNAHWGPSIRLRESENH